MILLFFTNFSLNKYKFYKNTKDLKLEYLNSFDKATKKPSNDIYYIILDSYPRKDFLKDIFSFENEDFMNYLEEKGFYIASESFSNYPVTGLIPSCVTKYNNITK